MDKFAIKPQRPAWLTALLILLVSLVGFLVVGPIIGVFIAFPFAESSFLDFVLKDLADPVNHPAIKIPYFIIQGCATFVGLVVIPYFYAREIEKIDALRFFKTGKVNVLILLITAGIVIFFMGFNSVVIEWNSKISFPEFMKNFEIWARDMENRATELTEFITHFDNTGQFVFGLIVIAIIPGIGEELVFRGLLQPALHRFTKNIHVAIWISALLFSALHMQFFGFVPRVLLGALFGYLYFWSGNLTIPMFAHFVNNAFSVIAIYMVQKGIIDTDEGTTDIGVDSTTTAPSSSSTEVPSPLNTDTAPWLVSTEAASWPVVISFSVLTIVLIYIFKKQFDNQSPA